MSDSSSKNKIEEIAGPLENHARQLWGPEKAAELRAAIEATAASIAILQVHLPSPAEEPGFYFQ